MPKVIKDGDLRDDHWLPVDPDSESQQGRICSLPQWLALSNKAGSAVQLEPGDSVEPLLDSLGDLALVAVHFPAFMDGRGFSYARELRERGYAGELRATGQFIRDQMTYLHRVGFNAFQLDDETLLPDALNGLGDLTEFYQASIDQPQPLFRRR